jgi:hypothetical protein
MYNLNKTILVVTIVPIIIDTPVSTDRPVVGKLIVWIEFEIIAI